MHQNELVCQDLPFWIHLSLMLLIPLIHRYINDQLLEPGVKFHMEKRKGLSGDYTHSLSIDNTEVENAGEVKAVALNKAGETITSATLTVEGNKIVNPCHAE